MKTYELTENGLAQRKLDIANSPGITEVCPWCFNDLTFKGLEISVFCESCNTHVLIENGHISG